MRAGRTPPTITLTNPANAAVNVPLNAAVNATFSEAMDPVNDHRSGYIYAGGFGSRRRCRGRKRHLQFREPHCNLHTRGKPHGQHAIYSYDHKRGKGPGRQSRWPREPQRTRGPSPPALPLGPMGPNLGSSRDLWEFRRRRRVNQSGNQHGDQWRYRDHRCFYLGDRIPRCGAGMHLHGNGKQRGNSQRKYRHRSPASDRRVPDGRHRYHLRDCDAGRTRCARRI